MGYIHYFRKFIGQPCLHPVQRGKQMCRRMVFFQKVLVWETSLVIQWLRLHVSNTGDPSQGTRIPQATAKKRQRENCLSLDMAYITSAHFCW